MSISRFSTNIFRFIAYCWGKSTNFDCYRSNLFYQFYIKSLKFFFFLSLYLLFDNREVIYK